jgi:hypothetical protein
MNPKRTAKPRLFKDLFSDRFSDTWKLLSETSRFLSRTAVFAYYEEDLRSWRLNLQSAGKDGEEARRIRLEIIELRRSLRQQGFDLSLARQNLVLDGFRNDASLGEGFRRVVIFFGDEELYWLSGDYNHITLADLLERQMNAYSHKRRSAIRSKHYLWYLRRGNDLIISGSDTETKEDFSRLEAMAEANSLTILAKLKGLK